MIIKNHFILYVKNQSVSTEFYSKLLGKEPSLNVPGMTEFKITINSVLGLMPAQDIKHLLENKIENSESGVKAELYFIVDDLELYVKRAKSNNVHLLSEIEERNWGHNAAYFLDPDNYVIAFAEVLK